MSYSKPLEGIKIVEISTIVTASLNNDDGRSRS